MIAILSGTPRLLNFRIARTPDINNGFDNIYSAHKIKRVEATRMINCNSEARGKIKELLISNF